MHLLALSIGSDALGLGKASEAITWTNLAEKILKLLTTPSAVGGMAMIVLAGVLAAIMAWKHTDADDKFDAFNPRGIAMSVVDIGLFIVGVKLLFF